MTMKKNKILFAILSLFTSFISPAGAQRIMTLDECVAAARTGNTKAKDAQNDIQMAKEQQKYAHSKYFPMLNATSFLLRSNESLVKYHILNQNDVDDLNESVTDYVYNIDMFTISLLKDISSVGVSLVEPLYTGGKIHNYNKLAKLQVDARNLQKEVADDEIVIATEHLYYKILELHETDKTLAAVEKELENIHQDAVNIWENGIVNKNDVLSVELMQDQLSALRIKVDNGTKLLRRALAQYIGMADEDIDIDTTLNKEIIAPEQLAVSTTTALENRSETRLLDMLVEKSVLDRKIAKADMLPTLAIGATASHSKMLADWNTRVIGFAALRVPLSAFWSEHHEYKRKKIEEQKANDFRRDKRELITLQIQDAYDNLQSTYKQTQIAEKSIIRAEENLHINREYYREGLTTMSVLLDAQRQQQTALTQRATALCEYLQAKTKYLVLTGRRQY